jgi:hypothetical protein
VLGRLLPPVLVAQLANHPSVFRFHQGCSLRFLPLTPAPRGVAVSEGDRQTFRGSIRLRGYPRYYGA